MFVISAKRSLPEFGINLKIRKATVLSILKFSSGVIGYQILANLFFLFERGWITRQLGVENLTYYVVTMSLAIYIHSFIGSLVLIVFPLASELQKDTEKLLRLYTKAMKIVLFLIVFICASIIVHSRDFLSLWMGEGFSERAYLLLILHTITFSLLAIQTISWQMTEGLGYPQFNALIYAISLVFNWVLMIFLTQPYQNTGIALSRTIGFTILFLSIFYCEKWFFGKIQIRFWGKILLMLGAAVFVSILFQKFISEAFTVNWAALLGSILGGGVIYCLLLLLFGYLNAEDKLMLKNILKRNG
jgi:O-antigen/teichoic acid export membrane protein